MWLFSLAKTGSWKQTGKVGTPFPGSASRFARKLPVRSALQRPFERYFNGVWSVSRYCNDHCHAFTSGCPIRTVSGFIAKQAFRAVRNLGARRKPFFLWPIRFLPVSSGVFRLLQYLVSPYKRCSVTPKTAVIYTKNCSRWKSDLSNAANPRSF